MARIILPLRSRLSPSSPGSRGLAPSSESSHGGFDGLTGGGGTSACEQDSTSRGVPKSDEGYCDKPIPSIEGTPSSTAGQSSSHVSTPTSSTPDEHAPQDGHSSPHERRLSTPAAVITPRLSSPAISVSPPPPENTMTTTDASTQNARSTSSASEMQNPGISSRSSPEDSRSGLDMRALGPVLDEAANTSNSNRAPQPSASLPVTPWGPSRRRSSPRPEPVRHQVEDEVPPSDAFHEPAFQRRLEDTKTVLGGLERVLCSGSIHLEPDSTMKSLHERVQQLSRFQPLSTRTVGFVGDSGVGKSSLINSLLDKRSLARATNNGAACTCVVTEYHYHAEDDFIIEVDSFSEQEVNDQLADLLSCYRHFNHELRGGSLSQDERTDLNEKAKIAIDTFRSMFRGYLQDEDWLLQEAEAVVLEQFKTWLRDGNHFNLPDRHVVATLEGCGSLLTQLTSEIPSSGAPATWTVIRKIKVYLKAHILSKGLVLVDLPGLRDVNSARRNITERYILECHEIFAVCNIGRATTDVGVKSVFELAREARLEHVGIICTRSDDINPDEIKNDWGREHAQRIRNLTRSLNQVANDLKETEEELTTFHGLEIMDLETAQELGRLHGVQRHLKSEQNVKAYELKRYVVETRNTKVTDALRQTYQQQVMQDTFPVFCVSNVLYWEKREEDRSVAEPFLNLSGIIAVRRHCLAMIAASQLRASTRFLDHDVPALLSDIELWVQSGDGSTSAEEKRAVRSVLDEVEHRLRENIPGESDRVFDDLAKSLNGLKRPQKPVWNGTIYAAFCRAWGDHTTPACGHRNWNKEAMSAMVADVQGPWGDLHFEFEDEEGKLDELISDSWDEAKCLLESGWPSSSDPPDEIFEALGSRKYLLTAEIGDAFHKFDRNLSTLETDALTGINSSIFGFAMSKVYKEAVSEYGRGSDRRRKDIVAETLTDSTIFKDLMQELKRRFELHTNGLQQNIADGLSVHLDAVQATFDLVRQENVAEESERDPDFRRRVAEEVARIREMMGN
ncbi:hypothetical protein diail_5828 [Diaporthe ilicicola]|nr:hypothetical protein diail_5828 [Diaporthe ilicicola]